MKSNSLACPPDSILGEFGLGKLDAASAETVSQHLERCSDCRQRVASLSGDSFVGRLRHAGAAAPSPAQPGRTYVPGESLANGASSTDGSSGEAHRESARAPQPAGAANVSAPPELGNHPDYELVKELGQGGMGTVYLARNRMMDRLEVLKVVSKALLERPGALERFQQEIRSAAKLAHPNIVAAYSVLRPGDLLVFAMEHVPGKDLSQVVRERGALPVANAAFYIHQVANGLQHAHEKGMVHRDIKPNNLMLAVEGKKHVVKILDFGLAKATSEKGAETGLTKSGQMLGTPDYIAPEQTLSAQKADIRADIYSLGCTLYFLLSGGPPFQEASLYEILEAHHKRDPKPLNLARPEVPAELAAVVAKMMAKDPARRYQTPVEVARALVPFFKPGPTGAPAPEKPCDDDECPQYVPQTVQQPLSIAPPPVIGPPQPFPAPIAPAPPPVALPVAASAVPLMPLPVAVAVPSPVGEFDRMRPISVSIDGRQRVASRRRRWSSLPVLWQRALFLVAGAGAAVLLGIVFVLHSKAGAIRIEINDPQIEVAIKGTDIVLKKADNGRDIKLSPGKKALIVERGDFKFETDKLVLKNGGTVTVAVTLVDGRIEVKQGNKLIHEEKLPPPVDPPEPVIAKNGPPTAPGPLLPNNSHAKRFPCEIPKWAHGLWSIEGDELVQASCERGGGAFRPHMPGVCLFFGDSNWADYDFSFEARPVDGWDLRAHFRYQDDLNNCAYAIGGVDNTLQKVDIMGGGKFGDRLAQGPLTLSNGNWYQIEIRVRAQRGTCFLDGQNALQEFTIARHATGRVGFCIANAASFRFRNIVVKDANGKVLLEGLPDIDHATRTSFPGDANLADDKRVITPTQRTDLLDLARLPGDVLIGNWRKTQQGIQSDATIGAKLQFRCRPSGEYDVRLTFTRLEGDECMALSLCHQDARFCWWLGSHKNKCCGIASVNGWFSASNNTTFWQDPMFENGRKYTALVKVRDGSISTYLDGTQVGQDLRTDYSNVNGGLDASVAPNLLAIYTASPFIIHEAEIIPIGNGPPLAIAPYSALQARAHQEAWAKHVGVPVEQTNSIGMMMTLIPPGEFIMGGTQAEIDVACSIDKDWWQQQFRSESPQHRVTLTRAFYVGSCEVTQHQYERITGLNPSHFSAAGAGKDTVQGSDTSQYPVENVNWFEAVDFCNRLSEAEQLPQYYAHDAEIVTILGGNGYRLPTEAEWEYACRAGTTTRWSSGDSEGELAKYAWYLYHCYVPFSLTEISGKRPAFFVRPTPALSPPRPRPGA